MSVSPDQLQELYLAYFGRPADFDGYIFYTTANVTVENVAASFSTSAESQALYGPGFSSTVITAIYQNLFNREPDLEGLTFWTSVVASGALNPAQAALAILQGAQNDDKTMIDNKLAAAMAFTKALDTAPEIVGYSGANAAALARAQLHTITADTATLDAYIANLDAEIAAVIGVGGTIGVTNALTTGVDTFDFSANATTIDTVRGVVDTSGLPGIFGSGTYTVGDSIIGNGKTVVDLALTNGLPILGGIVAGNAPFATIKNATVNFTVATSGSLSIDASSWSSISTINLAAGGGTGRTIDLTINSLNSSAGLSIARGVGGAGHPTPSFTYSTLEATFTNGVHAALQANKAGSINVAGNLGAVVGTLAASTAEVGFAATAAAGKALSVGNVTIASNPGVTGSGAWLSLFQTNNKGADLNVGNITLGAKDVWLTVENALHTGSSPAANVTIGNIDFQVAASGAMEQFAVSNTSLGKVGNLTVGDVNVAMGASATVVASAGFLDSGVGAVGDLTIGNVSIALGTSVDLTNGFHFENQAAHNGAKSTTVGNLSIGSLNYTLAQGAAVDRFEVSHFATATGAGSATAGTTDIGAINLALAQSASMTFSTSWDIRASAFGAGNASLGDIAIGPETASLSLNAHLAPQVIRGMASVANTGATTAAATVGNVSVGDIDLTLGIGASVSQMYHSFTALGSAISSVGNVAFGNVTVNGDDGAQLNTLKDHVFSSGNIGDVSLGGVSLNAGVSGLLHASAFATAAGSVGAVSVGDISLAGRDNSNLQVADTILGAKGLGDITVGNVSEVQQGTNARLAVYQHFRATSTKGAVGTVNVGNVSLTGATATGAGHNTYYQLWVDSAKAVGNVNVGDISINAVGTNTVTTNADVNAQFFVDGIGGKGALGDLTIGNVDIVAKGTGEIGAFTATLGWTAASAGTLTVGNITLDIGEAKATTQEGFVVVNNHLGNAVVGDITINGAQRGADDTTMTYAADVNVIAKGTVTVGNITVKGDTNAADLGNLGFLNLVSSGGKAITIGNVDYSGYKGATTNTIDVSGFKGAGSIVGTAGKDIIVDNAGTNALTGGAGADLFHFLNVNYTGPGGATDVNKNLTVATADSITDFNEAQGDRINVGTGTLSVTPGSATYGEGSTTYADLTAVITAAKAAEASGVRVFVGQVGTDSYVVVDNGADGVAAGSPDFVVKLVGVNYAHIDVSAFV
jgi:hypothetical protein